MSKSYFTFEFELKYFPEAKSLIEKRSLELLEKEREKLENLVKEHLTRRKFWFFGKVIVPTQGQVDLEVKRLLYNGKCDWGGFNFMENDIIFNIKEEGCIPNKFHNFLLLCDLAIEAKKQVVIFYDDLATLALEATANIKKGE